MALVRRQSWLVWLALGAIGGLAATGVWPTAPLHAVATDHGENFAIATGLVDDSGVEALYVLDFVTGNLKGAVLSNLMSSGGFQTTWEANVLADLTKSVTVLNAKVKQENAMRRTKGLPARPEVQVPQSPRYMLVTGTSDLRRGSARVRPSRSVVYVAEATTGVVLVYVAPWAPEQHSNNTPYSAPMALLAVEQFASTVVRTE
jgi:hypothetical protein